VYEYFKIYSRYFLNYGKTNSVCVGTSPNGHPGQESFQAKCKCRVVMCRQ
jgi:hypothetical protein